MMWKGGFPCTCTKSHKSDHINGPQKGCVHGSDKSFNIRASRLDLRRFVPRLIQQMITSSGQRPLSLTEQITWAIRPSCHNKHIKHSRNTQHMNVSQLKLLWNCPFYLQGKGFPLKSVVPDEKPISGARCLSQVPPVL